MALNALELKILSHLLASSGRRSRVLLLGYPDLLCDEETLARVGVPADWASLPKRADSPWQDHGRALNGPMLETKGFLAALGGAPVITDAFRWGGEDYVLDLNRPLRHRTKWKLGKFDLIVDPGTVEHCFNIAQAFENIVALLAPGGFVYHQAAVAFPNHGFWSISPTAFFDFYQSRGFTLGTAYVNNGALDENGFIPRIRRISCFETGEIKHIPAIGNFMFRKSAAARLNFGYPVQRCYSSLSRDVETVDYVAEALSDKPDFAAQALSISERSSA